MAPSTAASGAAPTPAASSVRWPWRVVSGSVKVLGALERAMSRLAYSAVMAAAASSSHSHSRVVSSLRNSPAIRRGMSASLLSSPAPSGWWLAGLAGECEEGLFQAAALDGQLVQPHPCREGKLTHPGSRDAGDPQGVRPDPVNAGVVVGGRGQGGQQLVGAGGADQHHAGLAGQLGKGALPHQPAVVDDHDLVDELLYLREHMAGHQHRAAVAGELA